VAGAQQKAATPRADDLKAEQRRLQDTQRKLDEEKAQGPPPRRNARRRSSRSSTASTNP